MWNDWLSIGPFTIHGYGVMIAIGIIAAYLMIESRAKKRGLDYDSVFGLVICSVLFGFAGAKLLYLITILPEVLEDPGNILLHLSGGWVVMGGILAGILGAYLYCRRKNLPHWAFFDLALAGVALAQGFGRIGCFFAGCCYGIPTDSIIGITFTHSHYGPNGVKMIPTQLISSGLDFLLCAFLVWYSNKKQKNSGEVTGLYLICYSIGRFVLEFFRGDAARGSVGVLSTSQFIGLFTLTAGIVILGLRRNKKTLEEAEMEQV
ncbi:MAG: prolipoprotein diacylglyceryl transferase [Lachnospiraceae bacterium]|nr:prolipoprotein diacylglyceryl transferase [Lachnospiraceae bacterium]